MKKKIFKHKKNPLDYMICPTWQPGGKRIYYIALDNQKNEFCFLGTDDVGDNFSVNISVDELIKSKGINPTVISRLIRKKRSAENEL